MTCTRASNAPRAVSAHGFPKTASPIYATIPACPHRGNEGPGCPNSRSSPTVHAYQVPGRCGPKGASGPWVTSNRQGRTLPGAVTPMRSKRADTVPQANISAPRSPGRKRSSSPLAQGVWARPPAALRRNGHPTGAAAALSRSRRPVSQRLGVPGGPPVLPADLAAFSGGKRAGRCAGSYAGLLCVLRTSHASWFWSWLELMTSSPRPTSPARAVPAPLRPRPARSPPGRAG